MKNLGGLLSRIPATYMHITLATIWGILAIPTALFWSNSILWILMISIYANIGAHLAAYEGAKDDAQIAELIDEVKKLRQQVEQLTK